MEDADDDNSNYVCRLSSSEVNLPLYVRSRKDGDKIDVMNMSGSKKIKDIFIDEKIPMSERKQWPLVVDSDNNIVWIPGIKKSKYNKSKDEKCDIIIKYD
jgi:tRNA(Ile)-lysidine synthase